ncbi:CBL-interacting serine/threonine-protein kinase 16 [Sarcoptes scabiei]|uniref:CBL-interacting serine/threonine-protein kinase 16 n=1 Tax=Sarcoptes scabiei TaxID=52283 RepID=A0A131ZZ64_SARSC|nr:CBL-interacting serine/threonine-protein kinase 16 [Sarcoptes scabiei]KPM03963.1 protein kinase-like protein 7 [Sarcoptes scabiei]UXI19241.1 N [Sarcoptes scabiei] [Sarcoptes scabiei]
MPYYNEKTKTACDQRNLIQSIKLELKNLRQIIPSLSTDDECFSNYQIHVEEVIFSGHYSSIYLAQKNDCPEIPLVARVFEPHSQIDPAKSRYLRLLKHLDRRNQWLTSTWAIFHDFNRRVVIFQEFAIHGNLMEYVRSNNIFVPEFQLLEWAHNIYNAMDFLGSLGLCHRSINPKHILLTSFGMQPDRLIAKLSSFRDCIIYFDVNQERSIRLRCRSTSLKCQGNFQAPETYGNIESETFDPIAADIWSYGATLFYAGSRTYPYNYKRLSSSLSTEINKMIFSRNNLTIEALNWFDALLRPDPLERISFDEIRKDPWFRIRQCNDSN